jgi:hypothetical protein
MKSGEARLRVARYGGQARLRVTFLIAAAAFSVALTRGSDPGQRPRDLRPNFASDVAPILNAHCVMCHRPGGRASLSLVTLDDVRAQGERIVEVTRTRQMPPWTATQGRDFPDLKNDPRLSDGQIRILQQWTNLGMPAGDLSRAPLPPNFSTGWPLGVPDLILTFARQISLPADSADRLFNMMLAVNLPGDRWIAGLDYQASPGASLKHALFLSLPADVVVDDQDVLPGVGGLLGLGAIDNLGERLLAADRGMKVLGAWTTGGWPRLMPTGMAQRLPSRTNIVLQLHAPAAETGAIEDGRVAIYLAKEPVTARVTSLLLPPSFGIASGIDIPAGGRYTLVDTFTLPVDVEAVGARGHAHALAQRLSMTAAAPGKPPRGLLAIGKWDPQWRDTYLFEKPVTLKKGTVLRVEINYDNQSLINAAPRRRVVWGPHLSQEIGGMELLLSTKTDADAATLEEARAQHFRALLLKSARH